MLTFHISLVREYHRTYYVPHNFTLIVAGKLASGTHSLLDVVQNKIEPVIIAHGQNQGPRPKGWKRPFLETPSAFRPIFSETIRDSVEFPEKDESVGELQVGFIGPHPQDFLEGAVSILVLICLLLSYHTVISGPRHAWYILNVFTCCSSQQGVRGN